MSIMQGSGFAPWAYDIRQLSRMTGLEVCKVPIAATDVSDLLHAAYAQHLYIA